MKRSYWTLARKVSAAWLITVALVALGYAFVVNSAGTIQWAGGILIGVSLIAAVIALADSELE